MNGLFEGIEMPYVNNETYEKLLRKAELVRVVAHNASTQKENMKYWKVSSNYSNLEAL